MHTGNHWRKKWPEGHTDDGEGDADVLNRFNLPKKTKAEKEGAEKYQWEYDSDVVGTGKSIDSAENSTKDKLTFESVVKDRGNDMVFSHSDAGGQGRAKSPTDS